MAGERVDSFKVRRLRVLGNEKAGAAAIIRNVIGENVVRRSLSSWSRRAHVITEGIATCRV
jgi:hypothetical protein